MYLQTYTGTGIRCFLVLLAFMIQQKTRSKVKAQRKGCIMTNGGLYRSEKNAFRWKDYVKRLPKLGTKGTGDELMQAFFGQKFRSELINLNETDQRGNIKQKYLLSSPSWPIKLNTFFNTHCCQNFVDFFSIGYFVCITPIVAYIFLPHSPPALFKKNVLFTNW